MGVAQVQRLLVLLLACALATTGAAGKTTRSSRRMLGATTVSKCLKVDEQSCSINPAYLLTLPVPASRSGRLLKYLAAAAYNCSGLTEAGCAKQAPCTWTKVAGSCSITLQRMADMAPPALVCPKSQASAQMSCSSAGDSQPECTLKPGCNWTAAGCLIAEMANKTAAEQQHWVIDFMQMNEKVWGSCAETALLAQLLSSCRHPSQATCEADASCQWAAVDSHTRCKAAPAAVLQAVAGADAFGSASMTALRLCSSQTPGDDCSAAGSFELPATVTDAASEKEFGYLLQSAQPAAEFPGPASHLSLETVRAMQYVGVVSNTSEAQCLPVNNQGMLAYTDCLQLHVKVAAKTDASGSRQWQLVPAANKSELNCPCVFMLAGSLAPSGSNASVLYTSNKDLAAADEADAYIAAHASLAKTCSAQLAQEGVGQSVLITYEGGKHAVATKAAKGAHYTVTVSGSYVLMTDPTGCALQFKVTERGIPDLLPGSDPAPSTPPPAPPATAPPAADLPKLSTVQLVSYQGLRKGMEESCLPVNSHGFSPYTSCMHFHFQSLPAAGGPRNLKLDPDQGLSQYMCPCLLHLNGSYTDSTEVRAEVAWGEMDWSADWNVREYVGGHPETLDACSASTKGGSTSLLFQANGMYQVTVPTGAIAKVVLEREGDMVLMQDQQGCVLEFMILQEDTQEPPAPEALGPNALAAVEELNYVGLLGGDATTCLPVNSGSYCPLEDCLSWTVKTTGFQVELAPRKGLSEFGCPCLLSMAGSLKADGGPEANLTFEQWNWDPSWDIARYMAGDADMLMVCNVTQVPLPGQSKPLSVTYAGTGSVTVSTGSPAARYRLLRSGYSATITDATNGCTLLYDVKDTRGLLPGLPVAPTDDPWPSDWIDYDYTGTPADGPSADPFFPAPTPNPAPEPEKRDFENVVEVAFRDVLLGSKSGCLPSNKMGYSPVQDCYSMQVKVNKTHVELQPQYSISEFGCPCLFRLVGPITQNGDVQEAQLVYKEMVWGPEWDLPGYLSRNADLPSICTSSLMQAAPSQQLNLTFTAESPYYHVSISQKSADWQYRMQREGNLITLQDHSHCKLGLLISAETTGTGGAAAANSGSQPGWPSSGQSQSGTTRHSKKSGVAIAAIVVPSVVVGLGLLVAVVAIIIRMQRAQQGVSYDALESAELADMQGMNLRDKFAFLVPYQQL